VVGTQHVKLVSSDSVHSVPHCIQHSATSGNDFCVLVVVIVDKIDIAPAALIRMRLTVFLGVLQVIY